MPTTDAERAERALRDAPVKEFALEGSKGVAEVVRKVGNIKLQQREGGGRWSIRKGRARVITEAVGDGWATVLSTKFMGMEWGGFVTNVYGNKFGTKRAGEAGLKPMWAPWHRDYKKGYIIGSTWIELDKGEATGKMADQVMRAYRQEFDKARLKKG